MANPAEISFCVLMGLPLLALRVSGGIEPFQRGEEIATCVVPRPAPQEAGTWRGSDIAHAATIVASSTRLVHMVLPPFFSSFAAVDFRLPAGAAAQSRKALHCASEHAGLPRRTTADCEIATASQRAANGSAHEHGVVAAERGARAVVGHFVAAIDVGPRRDAVEQLAVAPDARTIARDLANGAVHARIVRRLFRGHHIRGEHRRSIHVAREYAVARES